MHEWSGWHASPPVLLGDERTYAAAVAWLDGHGDIVDFGGGTGYAHRFVTRSRYRVVDGSRSPYVAAPVDLAAVTLETECLLLRHVLEHNHHWRLILDKALASFTVRAAIVTFVPLGPADRLLRVEADFRGFNGHPVSVLQLDAAAFMARVEPSLVSVEHFGEETVFYLERRW